MQTCFRVDASIDIGTGHVMRCLTLAHALKACGGDCRFICRDHPGNLNDIIRNNGFPVHNLCRPQTAASRLTNSTNQPAHLHWLGTSQDLDAEECIAILKNLKTDLLIADHYALDEAWETHLRPHVGRVMVIDDLADRSHNCEILLDQNPGRRNIDYRELVPDDCTIRTGPQFALLRPEFARLRAYSLARRKHPALKQLLISLGGVDKNDHTTLVLAAIQSSSLPPDCRISVVMGAGAPWLEEVKKAAAGCGWPTDVRVDVECMATIMAESDFAIGAIGVTALERCCMGLPTLAIITADNQRPGAAALQSLGALTILDNREDFQSELVEKLSLCSAPSQLAEMHLRCSEITRGTGATDIALELTHEQY
jgi:UDP-2,4-diacetamido-2,4,6-trideoxy-beta-L-altropyranose hydrolase